MTNDAFWPAVKDNFLGIQKHSELNLRDFMTICNAFKQAKAPETLDDIVFIRVATDKLLNSTD